MATSERGLVERLERAAPVRIDPLPGSDLQRSYCHDCGWDWPEHSPHCKAALCVEAARALSSPVEATEPRGGSQRAGTHCPDCGGLMVCDDCDDAEDTDLHEALRRELADDTHRVIEPPQRAGTEAADD